MKICKEARLFLFLFPFPAVKLVNSIFTEISPDLCGDLTDYPASAIVFSSRGRKERNFADHAGW